MIATLPQVDSRISPGPRLQALSPPSERDFEVYLAVHAEGVSSRAAAARFGISQTRVLQVRDRVAEWLGAAPPPMQHLRPRERVRFGGEVVKQRIDYLAAQAMEAWEKSKGTITKTRSSSHFDEVTTITTSHGDMRYLYMAMQLNRGYLSVIEAVEAAVLRVEEATRKADLQQADAAGSPGSDASRLPSLHGECSRETGATAETRLAAETGADANGDEPEIYDEFAERRQDFLAALADSTAPVQPPRTDANGMLIDESCRSEVTEDLSLLPMAAGAERLTGVIDSASSLANRVSVGPRPLSRKERRARKRMLEKLRQKAR